MPAGTIRAVHRRNTAQILRAMQLTGFAAIGRRRMRANILAIRQLIRANAASIRRAREKLARLRQMAENESPLPRLSAPKPTPALKRVDWAELFFARDGRGFRYDLERAFSARPAPARRLRTIGGIPVASSDPADLVGPSENADEDFGEAPRRRTIH